MRQTPSKEQFISQLCGLEDKKVVLASQSPRRIELLRHNGLMFDIYPVDGEETVQSYTDAIDYARQLARWKAEWVWQRVTADLVIAADTIVVKDNEIFGKPGNENEAREILRTLSNATHEVITALCLISAQQEIVDHEVTEVTFYPLSDVEIESYLASGEPFDKAGAYGIQGLAGLFVKRIEGCYFNVMGFPLGRFYQRLKGMAV